MAKVNIVRIPYKSGALQSADLIGGQVQLMFASASMTPHIKSGRLRAIAVTSTTPSSLFPGIPTVAASGLPGYESGSLYAMFAPAKTPSDIVNKVNQETVRYLKTPDAKEKYLNAGMETVGSTPEALAALIKADMARLGKVIKEAGIKGD
jgi:tripartite-type tricarboxylate transporter receptor subunit TctC